MHFLGATSGILLPLVASGCPSVAGSSWQCRGDNGVWSQRAAFILVHGCRVCPDSGFTPQLAVPKKGAPDRETDRQLMRPTCAAQSTTVLNASKGPSANRGLSTCDPRLAQRTPRLDATLIPGCKPGPNRNMTGSLRCRGRI